METSFQKIQKGTNPYIPIAHWSHKTDARPYTQTSRPTSVSYGKHHKPFKIVSWNTEI